MQQTFMKTKPVLPLVLSMSLPMVLSMLVASLYNIVDSYYVAKISEDAMTALSLVYPVQNLINAVTIGFAIGANAVISYQLGTQDNRRANAAATQSVLYNALHGLLLTVGCIGLMPWFLGLFTTDQPVIELGVRYSRIAFAFSIFVAIAMSMEKIFQAAGKMMLTMFCMMSGCVANIILDPLLIFGWGPFPQMGIEGAALATGIGQVLSLIIYIICYLVCLIPVRLYFVADTFDPQLAKRMYAAGSTALRVISLGFVISSLSIISCGALEGLGMGVPSLVISLLRYALLILPLAFILSRFTGAVGVWHAFWITEVVTAGIAYFLYKKRTSFPISSEKH